MIHRYCYIVLLILAVSGCKHEPENTVAEKEIPFVPVSSDTPFAIDSVLLKDFSPAVKDFYKATKYSTAWIDASGRKEFIKAVPEAAADGLYPEEYNILNLQNYEIKSKTKRECIDYDIMLTQSFLKLARHLFKGKVAAKSLYADWDLAPKSFNGPALLLKALQEKNIGAAIDNCRPPHAIYRGLRKAYLLLNSLPDDSGYKKIPYSSQIILNDSNPSLPAIKQRLAYWGDLDGAGPAGVYDRKTYNAVKKFQARHGIYSDGKINSKTVEALNTTKKQRLEQVVVNLERWRWFAHNFGERAVVINIANYWLAVVENNKDTIQMHKVVVGKPVRRTPVLYSKFNYLVINPTWTVPPTILIEDLVPSATEDRGYFEAHNMKIYDYSKAKNEIAPQDWDPALADRYFYVQGPGEDNSLGEIKFNFNNSHTVYLHDTNHRDFFVRQQRALSSGCVRVQNPFKLSDYILKQEAGNWTKEKMEELVALKETKNIYLKKVTHVHQLYWTAWLDKGGLQFRPDIYELDGALYKKLRN